MTERDLRLPSSAGSDFLHYFLRAMCVFAPLSVEASPGRTSAHDV